MFTLIVKKHGLLFYRGKETRTPCKIKIHKLDIEGLDLLEARLRSAGFKEQDYDLILDEQFPWEQSRP